MPTASSWSAPDFARVSVSFGKSDRTVAYLGAGQHYGFRVLYEAWKNGTEATLQSSLAALGYVNVLRVPAPVLEEHVFPKISGEPSTFVDLADRPISDDSLLEWGCGREIHKWYAGYAHRS